MRGGELSEARFGAWGPKTQGWGPAGFTPAGAGVKPPTREVGPRWIHSSGRGGETPDEGGGALRNRCDSRYYHQTFTAAHQNVARVPTKSAG